MYFLSQGVKGLTYYGTYCPGCAFLSCGRVDSESAVIGQNDDFKYSLPSSHLHWSNVKTPPRKYLLSLYHSSIGWRNAFVVT